MNALDGKIALRPTVLADLDFVLAAEQHPDNALYVGQWSRERHEEAIHSGRGCANASEDEAHFTVSCGSKPVGYIILAGLSDPHRAVSLRRIVVVEKGKGIGRQILQWVKAFVFEQLGYHRLWLDVVEGNGRARRLYESEGFVTEGLLRDAWRTKDGYESVVMMSMLESEHP